VAARTAGTDKNEEIRHCQPMYIWKLMLSYSCF